MIIRKFGLMLLSLLAVLALLESGLRILGYDPNPSPVWQYSSELGWTMDPQASGIGGLNSLGFRFRPVSTGKPPDQGRILLLGDSFTAGISLPYESTLPGRLEAWLGREKKDWRVISLAVDDWGTAQELLALQEIGLDFKPDAVVIQTFPFNDFCNNCKILADTCSLQDLHRPYFVTSAGQLVRSDVHPWRGVLRRRLRLFGLVENAFGTPVGSLPAGFLPSEPDQDLRRREYFRVRARSRGLDFEGAVYSVTGDRLQPAPVRECWDTTEAILRSVKEATDREGIPLIALVIPFLKSFPEEWNSLAEVFKSPIERDYDTRRFEEIFAKLGVPTISARSRIGESDMSYLDYFLSPEDGHLSGFGHAECASWVLTALQPLLGLAYPGPQVELTDSDLIQGIADWAIAQSGLEQPSPGNRTWRSGTGTEIGLEFRNQFFQRVLFTVELEATRSETAVRLAVNGSEIARSPALRPGIRWTFEGWIQIRQGRNSIAVELDPEAGAAVTEGSPPGFRVHRLELLGAQGSGPPPGSQDPPGVD